MRDQILQLIVDNATSFNHVGAVASLDAVMPRANGKPKVRIARLPAAILYPVGGSAAPAKDRPGGFEQTQTRRWGVMIITQSRNDASGEKCVTQADDLEDELDQALLGFEPEGATTSIHKSPNAGRMVQWGGDLYYYAAFYEVSRQTRIYRG